MGNLTGSLKGLQITQSSNASAAGGSTLSLSGRNLHLDSGTTFNLAVSNSTSVGNDPKPEDWGQTNQVTCGDSGAIRVAAIFLWHAS